MKTDINKKLLKLVSTEVLLQLGFERSTEQALNIITEIFSFYLESLIKKAISVQKSDGKDDSNEGSANTSHLDCRYLIEDTYHEEQYQIKELVKFMEQQIALKTQLTNRHDVECEESLFHALRLLPKGASLRSVFKNTRGATLEEKKTGR
ncbi:uncharacterized protein VICG_00635 [Vittaforma corneae ATCC 50505]|uniref:Bromodomain associated domain-containing protein n=1 Tax=Vittaforma corneae (strain ATCC 50505) TaxID=993615 RepID=L2GN33_VITCO|nr:uncharacterized protein VICG_00635 [Vittaforma corneae ATCC 50505]ELA42236.1 hypothetical protein VICG_00635 [Vittaforma corneae ATCC 50505]